MIEILAQSEGSALGIKGSGKLTDEDYKNNLIPRLEAILKEHPKANLLFLMDHDFKGWKLGAALDYAKFGVHNRHRFDKVAAVCGPNWVHLGMKLTSYVTDGKIRSFSCDQLNEAWDWIKS
ncbi:MAG: STAS/SEC14 domain-containing protein [Deltaproteobacteria bacterium]|nr:STAS/SEC14 domain-containing protein [Deltaproteobacteria bacterium]